MHLSNEYEIMFLNECNCLRLEKYFCLEGYNLQFSFFFLEKKGWMSTALGLQILHAYTYECYSSMFSLSGYTR
jgi:hypothetical protein